MSNVILVCGCGVVDSMWTLVLTTSPVTKNDLLSKKLNLTSINIGIVTSRSFSFGVINLQLASDQIIGHLSK